MYKTKFSNQPLARMSMRLPESLKDKLWARAVKRGISASDVLVEIIADALGADPKAPPHEEGSTKGLVVLPLRVSQRDTGWVLTDQKRRLLAGPFPTFDEVMEALNQLQRSRQ